MVIFEGIHKSGTAENQQSIKESYGRFYGFVDSMDDVVYTLDKEQRHTAVYGKWLEKTGLNPEHFLMKKAREILGDDAALVHEIANQRALAGESVSYEWEMTSNESQQYFQTSLSPIWDETSKEVIGIVGIARDISQRKQMESELLAYQQSLEELVASRTQELLQSNKRLETEILEREKAHTEAVYQHRLAESLREISGLLNRSLDLDSIFRAISETIGTLLPYDKLSFLLCECSDFARIYSYPQDKKNLPCPKIRLSDEPYLNEILAGKKLVRYESLDETNFSAIYTNLRSSLSAPICFEGKLLGLIHLGSEKQAAFEIGHEEILQSFISHVAIAVHNAQQYQYAQELAVTQERNRIARDLHDAVTQTLFSANLVTETLLNINPKDYEQSQAILGHLQHLIRGSLSEMRALLMELRPQVFENASLACLLRQLADAFYSRSQIPVEIIFDKTLILEARQCETFYRIAQEALNNIAKHSQAKKVIIRQRGDENNFQLSIEDNGIGFQTQAHEGMGLAIMRERAEQIGANLRLETSRFTGTRITVDWSLKNV